MESYGNIQSSPNPEEETKTTVELPSRGFIIVKLKDFEYDKIRMKNNRIYSPIGEGYYEKRKPSEEVLEKAKDGQFIVRLTNLAMLSAKIKVKVLGIKKFDTHWKKKKKEIGKKIIRAGEEKFTSFWKRYKKSLTAKYLPAYIKKRTKKLKEKAKRLWEKRKAEYDRLKEEELKKWTEEQKDVKKIMRFTGDFVTSAYVNQIYKTVVAREREEEKEEGYTETMKSFLKSKINKKKLAKLKRKYKKEMKKKIELRMHITKWLEDEVTKLYKAWVERFKKKAGHHFFDPDQYITAMIKQDLSEEKQKIFDDKILPELRKMGFSADWRGCYIGEYKTNIIKLIPDIYKLYKKFKVPKPEIVFTRRRAELEIVYEDIPKPKKIVKILGYIFDEIDKEIFIMMLMRKAGWE